MLGHGIAKIGPLARPPSNGRVGEQQPASDMGTGTPAVCAVDGTLPFNFFRTAVDIILLDPSNNLVETKRLLEVVLMAFFRALFLSIVSILDEGVDGDITPSIESPLVTDDTVDDGIAQ